jgi:hypothetical protein
MEAMKNEKDKNKALKAYTEFLTNLEVGTLKNPIRPYNIEKSI